MKDGTIPQMTAVGPPDGSANDNEAAIAVHLDKLSRNTTVQPSYSRIQHGISHSNYHNVNVRNLFLS